MPLTRRCELHVGQQRVGTSLVDKEAYPLGKCLGNNHDTRRRSVSHKMWDSSVSSFCLWNLIDVEMNYEGSDWHGRRTRKENRLCKKDTVLKSVKIERPKVNLLLWNDRYYLDYFSLKIWRYKESIILICWVVVRIDQLDKWMEVLFAFFWSLNCRDMKRNSCFMLYHVPTYGYNLVQLFGSTCLVLST